MLARAPFLDAVLVATSVAAADEAAARITADDDLAYGWHGDRLGFRLRRLQLPVSRYLRDLAEERGWPVLAAASAVLRASEPRRGDDGSCTPPALAPLLPALERLHAVGEPLAVDPSRWVDPRRRYAGLGYRWLDERLGFTWRTVDGPRLLADLLSDLAGADSTRLGGGGPTVEEAAVMLRVAGSVIASLGLGSRV